MDQNYALTPLSDEELAREMEELLRAIDPILREEEQKISVLNAPRMRQFQFAYSVLCHITQGSGAEVSYCLFEPFRTSGSITILAPEIVFSSSEWFVRAAEFADTIEIYPRTDGKICVAFSFDRLTTFVD